MKTKIPLLLVASILYSCGTIEKFNTLVNKAGTTELSTSSTKELLLDLDKSIAITDKVSQEFLVLDLRYYATLQDKAPEVNKYANYLRAKVLEPIPPGIEIPQRYVPRIVAILKGALITRNTYVTSTTPEGRANLQTALKTLKSILNDCNIHITFINKLSK